MLPLIALGLIQNQLLPEPVDLSSGDITVDPENRAQEEIRYSGIESATLRHEYRQADRNQSNADAENIGFEKILCDGNFQFAEPQFIFLPVRVPIEQRIGEEDSNESDSVHDHHCRCVSGTDDGDNLPVGERYCVLAARIEMHDVGKDEFQRVDIEQDHKEKKRVDRFGERILKSVSAKIHVVNVPDPQNDGEAGRERDKSLHGVHKLAKRSGDLQGNNEEGDRKSKDGVAEGFETGNLATPPAESESVPKLPFLKELSNHGCPQE